MNDFSVCINGNVLEYLDDEHLYLVDGVIVPSITQLLGQRFSHRFDGIDKSVLKRAAELGTAVHEAIEALCETGEERDLPEVRNFKFLRDKIGFEVVANEQPVILYRDGDPIAAGRLDLVLQKGDQTGGADIKRTSVLDKDYVSAQLNLYRQAFKQSYHMEWSFLAALHLKGDIRKYVEIPVWDEESVWEFIDKKGE